MRREIFLLPLLAVVILFVGCSSSNVTISGKFICGDAKSLYLERVMPLSQTIVDSVTVGLKGEFEFSIEDVSSTPSLYNIIYNGERIPIFVSGGERITVGSVGSVIANYTVEGSAESELLRGFYQEFIKGGQRLDYIASEFSGANTTEQMRDSLTKEYTKVYYDIRKAQLRFIVENKSSLAALYALYQRLPGDAYLFNGDSDVIYYREVAQALEESYPESPYLLSLLGEIARMDAQIEIASKITEVNHPDLEMADIFGRPVRLSSLNGKVVLLDFWSAEYGNTNVLNAELKQIYDRYKDKGFEVYQVAIDNSKVAWINAVQEQKLPWISVSDLQGQGSVALRIYNVKSLPANFLIDKDGMIVAQNIYGKSLERKLDALTK